MMVQRTKAEAFDIGWRKKWYACRADVDPHSRWLSERTKFELPQNLDPDALRQPHLKPHLLPRIPPFLYNSTKWVVSVSKMSR